MTKTVKTALFYHTCEALMDTCRDMLKGKPIGNETRLYYDDDYYYVELFGNRIMEIHPKHWVLYHAGWRTITTKMRLNRYTPPTIMVRSKQGAWYLRTHEREVKDFYDGMTIPFPW